MDDNSHRLLPFLLFARMFPISPSWLLNIVAPFLNIPLPIFAISALIGLAPYNFICVQAGYILADLRSWDDVFSTSTMFKLCSFALLPLAYAMFLRRKSSGGGDGDGPASPPSCSKAPSKKRRWCGLLPGGWRWHCLCGRGRRRAKEDKRAILGLDCHSEIGVDDLDDSDGEEQSGAVRGVLVRTDSEKTEPIVIV